MIKCTVCFAISVTDQKSDLRPKINEPSHATIKIKDFMFEELKAYGT